MEPEPELGPEQPETIQAAFERQVARSPHATAVVEAVDSSHRLSYSELRNASKELARCLLAAVHHARRAGQQPSSAGSANAGNVVAVLVGSSVERMVSYYACLFAGCAFCPLEAGWPSKVCEKALVSCAVVVGAYLGARLANIYTWLRGVSGTSATRVAAGWKHRRRLCCRRVRVLFSIGCPCPQPRR